MKPPIAGVAKTCIAQTCALRARVAVSGSWELVLARTRGALAGQGRRVCGHQWGGSLATHRIARVTGLLRGSCLATGWWRQPLCKAYKKGCFGSLPGPAPAGGGSSKVSYSQECCGFCLLLVVFPHWRLSDFSYSTSCVVAALITRPTSSSHRFLTTDRRYWGESHPLTSGK